MERQWNEIVLENDSADEAFARAAPLLVEALQLIESAQAVSATTKLANHVMLLMKSSAARQQAGHVAEDTILSQEDALHPFFPFSLERVRGRRSDSASAHKDLTVLDLDDEGTPRPSPMGPHSSRQGASVEGTQAAMLSPFLDAILTSFAPVRMVTPERQERDAYVCCRPDGLVGPSHLQLQDTMRAQPYYDYAAFVASFERLSRISTTPLLFTACEPRLKVLESTYALYRAYNGAREDGFHPVYGGGDVKLAPKVDIRRLETCMPANVLVSFLDELRESLPHYRLDKTLLTNGTTTAGTGGDREDHALSSLTVRDVFGRFFGAESAAVTAGATDSRASVHRSGPLLGRLTQRAAATVSPHRGLRSQYDDLRVGRPHDTGRLPITAESLCLRPNYAQGSVGGGGAGVIHTDVMRFACPVRYRDGGNVGLGVITESASPITRANEEGSTTAKPSSIGPVTHSNFTQRSSSRAFQAARLLQYFLNLHSINQGELLAELLSPYVREVVLSSGSDLDALELELTVTGSDRQELVRIAKWCCMSGLLDDGDVDSDTTEKPGVASTMGGATAERSPSAPRRPQVQFCLRVTQGAYMDAMTAISLNEGAGGPADNPSTSSSSPAGSDAVREAIQHMLGDTSYARFVAEEIAKQGHMSSDAAEKATASTGHASPPKDFADVLTNIFAPIWDALLADPASPSARRSPVARLLRRVVAVSVQLGQGSGTAQDALAGMKDRGKSGAAQPVASSLAGQYPLYPGPIRAPLGDGSQTGPTVVPPPDAFFAFHIRRNVELLNCFSCAHEYFYAQHILHGNDGGGAHASAHHGASPYFIPSQSPFTAARPTFPGPLRFRLDSSAGGVLTPGVAPSASSGSDGRSTDGAHVRKAGGSSTLWLDNDENGEDDNAQASPSGVASLTTASRGQGVPSGSNDVRTALAESVLGLLMADEIVNPSYVFEWGPIAYLYYLTQRHVVLTPSRNKAAAHMSLGEAVGTASTGVASLLTLSSAAAGTTVDAASGGTGTGTRPSYTASAAASSSSSASALSAAIPFVVSHGLNASLATMDPLLYHNSSDALQEELEDTVKHVGLATPDVTEMCLRSVESRSNLGLSSWGPWAGWVSAELADAAQATHVWDVGAARRRVFGAAWPYARSRFNDFAATQLNSLRIRQRNRSLRHELELVSRKGLSLTATADALSNAAHASSGAALLPANGTLSSGQGVSFSVRRQRLFAAFGVRTAMDVDTTDDTPVFDELSFHNDDGEGEPKGETQTVAPRTLPEKSSRYHYRENAMLFPRILITGPTTRSPSVMARAVVRCVMLREYYQHFTVRSLTEANPTASSAGKHGNVCYAFTDGVIDIVTRPVDAAQPTDGSGRPQAAFPPLPSWHTFQGHLRELRAMANDSTLQHYARRRLDMLECKYRLHVALTNDDEEPYYVNTALGSDVEVEAVYYRVAQGKPVDASPPPSTSTAASPRTSTPTHLSFLKRRRDPKGDVYDCVKVDNHCHAASGVPATTFLEFLRCKVRDHPDDIVGVDKRTGKPVTLLDTFRDVMRRYPQLFAAPSDASASTVEPMKPEEMVRRINIAALDVQAARATFNRFDDFNSRFSPMRLAAMRSLFLKTDNFMGGRYFAELIREGIFEPQAKEGKTYSEYRLSIYGRDEGEWERLASWFVLHGMSHRTNRWIIQVPRLFAMYARAGLVRSFADMLRNIFRPLWEVSLSPEKYPFLHHFLQHVSGFDSVDDESDREPEEWIHTPPQQWTHPANPPYAYYMYYMWANITTLNRLRASRGLSTFDFRPHAGESGDPDHMADVFFLADGVAHGINLSKRPVMQYLFYLTQIPLGVVPLSNNALFCKYTDNPFPHFLRRGLNVALSTDGALVFHATKQPLLEEYTTARNVWDFSAADIAEIARNSVCMSGFSKAQKQAWLGPLYELSSVLGNDARRSHVPLTRTAFRYENYYEEVSYLEARAVVELPARAMRSPLEEEGYLLDHVVKRDADQATSDPSNETDHREGKAGGVSQEEGPGAPRPSQKPHFVPSRAQLLSHVLAGDEQMRDLYRVAPDGGAEGAARAPLRPSRVQAGL